jgi:16S rRNA (guanine527-N7)-methyltransferase
MKQEKMIWFHEICIKNGFVPTDEQLAQLEFYTALLKEWNKKINIISRKDEEQIWTYHLLHSISPFFLLDIEQNSVIVDIGTGGGLPGIPMKIVRPDLSILCIDSTGKKINAVEQMIHELRLNNIKALWGRAEEIGLRLEYAGKFDFAVARAVAPLKDLLSWSKVFLKRREKKEHAKKINDHGRIDPLSPAVLAFKGGDLMGEIETVQRQQPQLHIQSLDLLLKGSEQLSASDKKIVIAQFE